MVASTNHLDKLDAGLSSRPSRFDRKYLFPLPSESERNLYCQFWRKRLRDRKIEIEFPKKICPAMALITEDFSFAYLQEAFVATLLAIAQRRSEILDEEMEKVRGGGDDDGDDGDRDLDDYELWREMKKTIKQLRDDMNTKPGKSSTNDDPFEKALVLEKEAQAPASGPEPSSTGRPESTISLRLQDIASEKKYEAPRIQGRTVKVDHDNVPIITDEKGFVYTSE